MNKNFSNLSVKRGCGISVPGFLSCLRAAAPYLQSIKGVSFALIFRIKEEASLVTVLRHLRIPAAI